MVRAGVVRPHAPVDPGAGGAHRPHVGHRPGRRLPDPLSTLARAGLPRGRARQPDEPPGPRAQQRHRARADGPRGRGGRRRRRDVPQPPLLRRRERRSGQARRRRPLPQHRLRGTRSWSRCSSARSPASSCTTRSSPAWSGSADVGRPGARPGSTTRTPIATCRPSTTWCGEGRPTTSGRPSAMAASSSSPPGTTGTPKGAPRNDPGLDAAVAILERIPLRAGMRVHVAAPLFHTWGFAHLALGMLLGTTMVLRRTVRPRGLPAHRRGRALRRRRRDPGDAAADHGPRRRRARALRPLPGVGGDLVGVGAAGRPRHPLDGPVRRPPLLDVRLHRGRLRQHRHPGRPARGPGHRREGAGGHGRPHPRRRRPSGRRPVRPGGSSSATPCSSRATPAVVARRSSTG